jgi:hypothetical protein
LMEFEPLPTMKGWWCRLEGGWWIGTPISFHSKVTDKIHCLPNPELPC